MSSQPLTIQRDATAMRVSGRIDLHSSPLLLKALRQTPRCYCLDLSGVTAMDSAGVATLIEGLKLARQDGQALLLQHLPEAVSNALHLAGVEALFRLED